MQHNITMESPIGPLCLSEENGILTGLSFGKAPTETTNAFLLHCVQQMNEYFRGERLVFELPLLPRGTAFEQKVWAELCRIPYGETRTYGEIAAAVGSPKGARAVGMACNRNPLALVIPCHRVVGANGKLTGYAGGLPVKEFLLRLEQNR